MNCCKCGRLGESAGGGELRPYGPGGAPICFDCATRPENQAAAEAVFGTLLDAAMAMSPVGSAVIGAELVYGPQPLLPGDLDEIVGQP